MGSCLRTGAPDTEGGGYGGGGKQRGRYALLFAVGVEEKSAVGRSTNRKIREGRRGDKEEKGGKREQGMESARRLSQMSNGEGRGSFGWTKKPAIASSRLRSPGIGQKLGLN